MTRPAAALNREPDRQPRRQERRSTSKLLNSLAARPWVLFCTSYMLTALLIRSNGLAIL
jgi:hypothetical protein